MLNRERVQLQAAAAVARGMQVANGADVGEAFYEASCDTEEEAAEMYHEARMSRLMAGVRGRR